MTRFQIIALIISLFWIIFVVELVRRRKLIGGYSLLWLLTGALLAVFALWQDLLVKLTHLLGMVNPPSTFSALMIIFLALILLEFSVRISKLSRQNKELTQKMALLELEMKKRKDAEE